MTAYRRLRHANLTGRPSSRVCTSTGSPYTLLMRCPALPARPARKPPAPRRVTRAGPDSPGEDGRNRVFARSGEPNCRIEYKFIRTCGQISPVTLATLTGLAGDDEAAFVGEDDQ